MRTVPGTIAAEKQRTVIATVRASLSAMRTGLGDLAVVIGHGPMLEDVRTSMDRLDAFLCRDYYESRGGDGEPRPGSQDGTEIPARAPGWVAEVAAKLLEPWQPVGRAWHSHSPAGEVICTAGCWALQVPPSWLWTVRGFRDGNPQIAVSLEDAKAQAKAKAAELGWEVSSL